MKYIIKNILVFLLFFTSTCYAETLKDWYPSVVKIIQNAEGSTETTVTPDSDAQGMSLGILQWNVGTGSFLKLINTVGKQQTLVIAKQTMPKYGNTFVQMVNLLINRKTKQARKLSLAFQRNGNMLPAAKKEIATWLNHPHVKKAQQKLIYQEMQKIAKITKQWKLTYSDKTAIKFPEFMFFFNTSVQGGIYSLKDGSLGGATKLVRGGAYYTKGNLKKRRSMLVNYLADWMSVKWPQAKSQNYYSDSRKNATLLRKNAHRLTASQVHLLFMKYTRASVGNTPYHLPFINRGVIDILGEGYVNQKYYNYRKIYDQRKPLQ